MVSESRLLLRDHGAQTMIIGSHALRISKDTSDIDVSVACRSVPHAWTLAAMVAAWPGCESAVKRVGADTLHVVVRSSIPVSFTFLRDAAFAAQLRAYEAATAAVRLDPTTRLHAMDLAGAERYRYLNIPLGSELERDHGGTWCRGKDD
jgi:hypothetical protein